MESEKVTTPTYPVQYSHFKKIIYIYIIQKPVPIQIEGDNVTLMNDDKISIAK